MATHIAEWWKGYSGSSGEVVRMFLSFFFFFIPSFLGKEMQVCQGSA